MAGLCSSPRSLCPPYTLAQTGTAVWACSLPRAGMQARRQEYPLPTLSPAVAFLLCHLPCHQQPRRKATGHSRHRKQPVSRHRVGSLSRRGKCRQMLCSWFFRPGSGHLSGKSFEDERRAATYPYLTTMSGRPLDGQGLSVFEPEACQEKPTVISVAVSWVA